MKNAITRCRGLSRQWLLTYGRCMNPKEEISKPEGHSTGLRKKERRELSRIQQQLLSHLFLVTGLTLYLVLFFIKSICACILNLQGDASQIAYCPIHNEILNKSYWF